jgi:hypothetical protein
MYGIGLVGAVGSLLYAVNTIWIFESGVSFEDMLVAVGISIALILLSAGLCLGARSFLNKVDEEKTAIHNRR